MTSEVCQLTLIGGGVEAHFVLEFRIASELDLIGVEKEFDRLVAGRRLDAHGVDTFIAAASKFESALGYCDGICSYMYGLMAKENVKDTSLSHDQYVAKFSKSVEALKAYNRPLAALICGLIGFHFNHFDGVADSTRNTRIGRVAARYQRWIAGKDDAVGNLVIPSKSMERVEQRLTDWQTEQIARWAALPLPHLVGVATEIESFLLLSDIESFDEMKLRILLTEVYAIVKDMPHLREHAKALRNISTFEDWAERKLRASVEAPNE
jgi:hypothetical protein